MTIITAKVFGTVGLAAVSVVGEGAMAIMAALDPSIPNIISVVVGAIVTITMGVIAYKTVMLNKRIEEIKKDTEAQTDKIDLTLRKTEVIEGHVNSEKTEAAGKIALLQNENALLRDMLTEKKTTAALLAQAAATTAAVPSMPTAPAPARTAELAVLKKTEQHAAATAESTAQTADNTAKTEASAARTEATVQELQKD